jgi:putative inorganic carbon (HCO3(-)) transporter
MDASPLQALGLLVACGGVAAAVAAPGWRWRHIALAVALIAAPVLILGDVWDDPRVADLRDSPALIAGGAVVLVAGIAFGAAVARRFEVAFPLAAFAVIALRVPVRVAGETSNLLIPLYLVIAAALAGAIWGELRHGEDGRSGAVSPEAAAVVWLRRLLAATLILYALQATYSDDVSNAIEDACFFLVPFAALFVLLTEVRWTERIFVGVAWVVGGAAIAYAAVAFGEYAARDLLLNSQLEDSNQIKPFFRVNSLFHDPNILGRYLALVVVVLGAGVAWSRGGWKAAVTVGAGLALLAALVLTFSLTSFAALLAGLVVLAALRWGLRWGAATVAATLLVGGALALAGSGEDDIGPTRGIKEATSGRTGLVEGGVELWEDRPIQGWGSGAFGRAFYDNIRQSETTTSHSEPLTVAAEQGIVGLAVYAALIGATLWVLFSAGVGGSPARAAVAACMVAMIVHSLGYGGFEIDPVTWALLALGVGLYPAASRPAGGEPSEAAPA